MERPEEPDKKILKQQTLACKNVCHHPVSFYFLSILFFSINYFPLNRTRTWFEELRPSQTGRCTRYFLAYQQQLSRAEWLPFPAMHIRGQRPRALITVAEPSMWLVRFALPRASLGGMVTYICWWTITGLLGFFFFLLFRFFSFGPFRFVVR